MLFRAKRVYTLALFVLAVLGQAEAARALLPGIDISHWQDTINWNQVAADPKGIKFAFMKATEDTNYTDPTFNTNLAGAKAAGILAGPYHFCRLNTNSTDPVADGAAEATYFLSKIKAKYQMNTYLPPVADVETFASLTGSALKTHTSAWTDSFSDTIYDALGVRPLIYTSQSKATTLFTTTIAAENPLWNAAWKTNGTASPPSNASVSPWSTWKFWQWSDDSTAYPGDGHINGFASSVRVDRDVFNGTMAQLTAMLVGKEVNAKPGDFNRDGVVNVSDYNVWVANNGKTVPIYSGADGNGDARVTSADLSIYLANAPEPGSCVLVFFGIFAFAHRSVSSRRATVGRMCFR